MKNNIYLSKAVELCNVLRTLPETHVYQLNGEWYHLPYHFILNEGYQIIAQPMAGVTTRKLPRIEKTGPQFFLPTRIRLKWICRTMGNETEENVGCSYQLPYIFNITPKGPILVYDLTGQPVQKNSKVHISDEK